MDLGIPTGCYINDYPIRSSSSSCLFVCLFDCYTQRYLATWLTRRRFSVRLATPQGRFYSSWRQLSRGLPQGGVLSPFLWLLHFNSLIARAERARGRRYGPQGGVIYLYLLCADDLLCVLCHQNKPALQLAAWGNDGDVEDALGSLGLSSARRKSENMLISPGDTVEDFHRR